MIGIKWMENEFYSYRTSYKSLDKQTQCKANREDETRLGSRSVRVMLVVLICLPCLCTYFTRNTTPSSHPFVPCKEKSLNACTLSATEGAPAICNVLWSRGKRHRSVKFWQRSVILLCSLPFYHTTIAGTSTTIVRHSLPSAHTQFLEPGSTLRRTQDDGGRRHRGKRCRGKGDPR